MRQAWRSGLPLSSLSRLRCSTRIRERREKQLQTRTAKILIQNFHVRPAGASFFDEISGFNQPHLAMQMQVGNGQGWGAIASGVTMQKEGVRLLGELVQDVQG